MQEAERKAQNAGKGASSDESTTDGREDGASRAEEETEQTAGKKSTERSESVDGTFIRIFTIHPHFTIFHRHRTNSSTPLPAPAGHADQAS